MNNPLNSVSGRNSDFAKVKSMSKKNQYFPMYQIRCYQLNVANFVVENDSYGHKSKHKTFFRILNIMIQLTSTKFVVFILLFFSIIFARGVQH